MTDVVGERAGDVAHLVGWLIWLKLLDLMVLGRGLGLDWIRLDWIGLIYLGWVRLDWIGLD